MKIYFNEREYELEEGSTFDQFAQSLDIGSRKYVRMINGNIFREDCRLKENDRIEIISFVGGG